MTREEEIQKAAEEHINNCLNRDVVERLLALSDFYAGAKWADEHTAKNQTATIDAWLARDWTGLYLCQSMPKSKKSYGDEYDLGNHIRIGNCKDIFKDVKDIKDGGKVKKVKVTIELEEE